MLSAIAYKLWSFAHLHPAEKAWLVPVWVLLGLSRCAVLTIPFRFLALRLGAPAGGTPCIPVIGPRDQKRALRIGRVVRMASRYTPWQSNCLTQAMTARILLGLHRIPCSFFLGVMRETENTGRCELKAHAWVSAGRIQVTGGDGFRNFAVVECFVSMV